MQIVGSKHLHPLEHLNPQQQNGMYTSAYFTLGVMAKKAWGQL
jgi:hypothetical protein